MNNTSSQTSRIRWACRRGMLELDLILLPFFDKHYSQLSIPDQQVFATLLECPDPELYDYLITGLPCRDGELQSICLKIRHMHNT